MSHRSGERATPESLGEATGQVLHDAAGLVQAEAALFRAEAKTIGARALGGVILLLLATAASVVALTLAAEAAVAWLAPSLGSQALAALAVALVAGLVAAWLFWWGRRRLAPEALAPRRSAASVRRDAALLRGRAAS